MIDFKETLDEYRILLSRYCYAGCDVKVRKNEDGDFYLDCNLKDCLYVVGGNFESDYVADEIINGDFPFNGIDREGYWHVEILLKNYNGGHDDSPYMEVLITEPFFAQTLEPSEASEINTNDLIDIWDNFFKTK